VDLQLKDTGARLFDEYAAEHYGDQVAIVLDDQVMSAPAIRASHFEGRAQITGGPGGFSANEANRLVTILRFGPLPLPVREVDAGDCGAVPVPAVLASVTSTAAQSFPPEARATRIVEIPGAGATVTLPRQWRTWWGEHARMGTGVWTTDLASGWTCQISAQQDLVSAEAAADEFVAGLEFVPSVLRGRTSFDVPGGHVVSVSFGTPDRVDPQAGGAMVYVDAPESVVLVLCGEAPIEHWLDVARSIAPLTADFSPEPFDPRVAIPEHGFAVDFGMEWYVDPRAGHLGALLGGPIVLTTQTTALYGEGPPGAACQVEDDTGVAELAGPMSIVAWKVAIRHAGTGALHAKEPAMKLVELPSGPAIRADWSSVAMPATAWILSDDERVVVLLCRSFRPPEDRWLSIAETFEFLPAA